MALAISGRQIPDSQYFQRAYESKDSGYGRPKFKANTRVMQQITDPFLQYEFIFPPVTVTHEGYGVGVSEIERPYSIPIVDITGGKSLRCSFEFTLAKPNDGFTNSIDHEIRLLQDVGNSGVPVEFWNVHPALSIPKWYIDSISFTHSRLNTLGQTTAASCSLSLIEFVPRNKTLILLPRFSYGKFNPIKKTTTTGTATPNTIDELKDADAAMISINHDYERKIQLEKRLSASEFSN